MSMIDNLEAMLASGQDSPLIRFGLGNALIDDGRFEEAATHLEAAVEQDAGYSAAWKLLGKAQAESGEVARAIETYRRGIEVAEAKGDKQTAKEMSVFLRRLERMV
jgi:predicted Zn-dependent protease